MCKTNKLQAPKPFRPSLGLWVWRDWETIDWLLLKRLRYRWVAVKAFDGDSIFNDPRTLTKLSVIARRYGLMFGIWGYTRSHKDAPLAAELVTRYRAQFFIADAEVEYENAPGPESRLFAQTFRTIHPKLYAAVSSFGRIDLHPRIDWQGWKDHGFSFMPQAYECESLELSPALCVRAGERVWKRAEIQPTLGAYRGSLGRLTSAQLAVSVRKLGLRGANFWEASTVTQSDLTDLVKVL